MNETRSVERPRRTLKRWATLERVFSTGTDLELHALIASLCVLFEDMRIELTGQATPDLGRLDECGASGRSLYFLRRSIATLHEFSTVLHALDQLPSFQPFAQALMPLLKLSGCTR